MEKLRQLNKLPQAGFTAIEVMLVVGLIGLIGASVSVVLADTKSCQLSWRNGQRPSAWNVELFGRK